MMPGKRKALDKTKASHALTDRIEKIKASIRAKVELNLPLLDVPLSHFIMRPSIAVPRPSVSQTASD
jgi:IS5 family transposase